MDSIGEVENIELETIGTHEAGFEITMMGNSKGEINTFKEINPK